MAKMRLYKNFGVMCPGDDHAESVIEQIPQGKAIDYEYSFPRSYENHKRIFAFFKETFALQTHFENPDIYRKWLIMKSGHCVTAVAPNGTVMFFPDSLSFDKMDEVEFKKVFKACIDTFLEEFGKKLSEEDFLKVYDFV